MLITIPAPRLSSVYSPKSILENHFPPDPSSNGGSVWSYELPIDGGWGYTKEDAVILHKDCSNNNFKNWVEIEYVFFEKRCLEELVIYRPVDDNYSHIRTEMIQQSLVEDNGRYYDELLFEVTASPDFNECYRDTQQDDSLVCYRTECWFYLPDYQSYDGPYSWKTQ